jgi:ribosomal protein L11 methyltransferase
MFHMSKVSLDYAADDLLSGSDPSIKDGSLAAATVARLVTDCGHAKRLSDLLAEQFDAAAVAIYESGPHWRIDIHFADPPDQADVHTRLAALVGDETAQAFRFETIAARDWVAASLAGLTPIQAGRFVVHGAHDRDRIAINRIAIEIEASLAFGTGHHETTRGCLLALDRLLKMQKRRPRGRKGGTARTSAGRRRTHRTAVLDIGTGSGVLAVAATKAARVGALGSDVDPAAVRIARENARRNGVGALVNIIETTGLAASRLAARRFAEQGPYAVIFANILLEPLKQLATGFTPLLAPDGWVVLSGLLPDHANAALATCRSYRLRLAWRIVLDGWVTLVLTRPQGVRPP